MDKHSIDVLELKKIMNEVKKQADTFLGQQLISEIKPYKDLDYIKERLQEVTQAKRILNDYSKPPFGGVRDIREFLKKSNKEVVLSIKELIDIENTLNAFRNMRGFFNDIRNDVDQRIINREYNLIFAMGEEVDVFDDLQNEINRCIDYSGYVKDDASSKLKSLRNQLESIENKVRDRLDSITKSSKYQNMLQETIVTRRENRYVVPVKKEYRNSFDGIVHDQSSSGMTIFMEPMEVVRLNNKLREIKEEEEREIYKILQQLTYQVAGFAEDIKDSLKQITILDQIFAKAKYSNQIDGSAPSLNDQGIIKIKEGRHPLLKNEPVPITIEAGDGFNNLVITGPNTGGKTVSLKTVGLFVLMVQSGLHIPAGEESLIGVFNKIFADIGDEQSIEQNLSTFSSHMNNINSYLEKADAKSLILLDELGAGTDPREGAALGIAILEKLKSKNAITIATTHYSQLKSYAYSFPHVENASVEFDLESLRPTYRLIMGVPGGSNAFEIALRLGLPEEIVEEARKLIDKKELEVENIITELNNERNRYQELREEAEYNHRKAKEMKEDYEQKLKELKEKKDETIKEAKKEAKEIIKRAEKKSKNIIRNLKDKATSTRPELDREATEINKELKEFKSELEVSQKEETQKVSKEEIKKGMTVRVRNLGKKGRVVDIEGDKAIVEAGVMKINADIEDLIPIEMPDVHKERMVKKYQVKKNQATTNSLDLRGMRYDDAQRKLDKYLDDVRLAGYSTVEVIHGKGTGALRKAVEEVLEGNRLVKDYRYGNQSEGGMGVTIVNLK
ncbi:MAG TPA: endonuclease MutS2 [Halanaerobiales bacterium]|nr:endonuclease MutS2 [Halanaerobiales bacterium]